MQLMVSARVGMGDASTFSKSSCAFAVMAGVGFSPRTRPWARANPTTINGMDGLSAKRSLATHRCGGYLLDYIRQLRAALRSDCKAVYAVECKRKLQALVGLVPQLAGAEDLHPHDAFSSGLHLPEYGDHSLGIGVHRHA